MHVAQTTLHHKAGHFSLATGTENLFSVTRII